MKLCLFLSIFILLQFKAFSQVETIPADNYIYDFLKNLSVKGIISNYDDMVLPLSKRKIINFLNEAEKRKLLLSDNEKEQLEKFRIKLDIEKSNDAVNLADIFPGEVGSFFKGNRARYLYSYKDSSLNLYTNPILENDFIYSQNEHETTNLLTFGLKMYGSYSDWFGFYVSASNGYQSGNRMVAELDQAVNQSFTFNNTRINYFDNTEGYARIEKGNIGLEIGRERVLWGRGINKLIISNNAPVFDFIKFNAVFGIFTIDFLHGWLTQPVFRTYDSSLNNYVQNKNPKYIAASRFGINLSKNVSFGVSQVIIYANRPIELAYLNPFLFLESAQRSLNDLDNSFLAFDARYKIINGLELSSIINFDDINFSTIGPEGFGSIQTRYAWESNIILTNPIMPENLSVNLDYVIIRPYVYSHYSHDGSLTYTNNGYMIGPDLQPNSIELSFKINYLINPDLMVTSEFDNIRHGNNIYDSNGNLVRNVGGDVLQFFRQGDSRRTNILDGILDVTNKLSVNLQYEFSLGLYLGFQYDYVNYKKDGFNAEKENNFWGVFRYNIL
jgi:hypothetical protein